MLKETRFLAKMTLTSRGKTYISIREYFNASCRIGIFHLQSARTLADCSSFTHSLSSPWLISCTSNSFARRFFLTFFSSPFFCVNFHSHDSMLVFSNSLLSLSLPFFYLFIFKIQNAHFRRRRMFCASILHFFFLLIYVLFCFSLNTMNLF